CDPFRRGKVLTKKQIVVVPDGEADPTQFLGQVVLVDEDGEPWSPGAGDSSPVAWGDVTGKPSTFTPATHSHEIEDVNGLESRLAAIEAALEGGEAERMSTSSNVVVLS